MKLPNEPVLGALKIFSDEPDTTSNCFNFGSYSDQLYDLIKNDIRDKSLAICLNGEWGSGKTSLLRSVFEKLEKEQNDKLKVEWFDAWQYERLDPVLALLQKIAFRYEKKDTKLEAIVKSLTLISSDMVIRKTTGLSLDEVKKHFETSVKEIATLAKTLEDIIGNDGRLIVLIDDLDRCNINNSLQVLESIKLLFNAKNAMFIVGVDLAKLQKAWALRHNERSNSLNEGADHMEKIFQLVLSLPPKVLISGEVNKKDEQTYQLIRAYLTSLPTELPEKLEEFIANSFPPNPRKIKRALSLAYFIGKNMEYVDEETFRFILIWTVATSYFSNLATILKETPSFLPKICLIIADTRDFGNLNNKISNRGLNPPPEKQECNFASHITNRNNISNRELEYVEKNVKYDPPTLSVP